MGTIQVERFRDTAIELKLIAYLIRKDHKPADSIDRDVFSIKAYKLFFDIVSAHKTTLPKDILKDAVGERVKNPDLLNQYIRKVYQAKIDTFSQKNIGSLIKKLKRLSFLRISLEKTEELIKAIDDGTEEDIRKISKQISSIGMSRIRVYSGEYLKDVEERASIIEHRRRKKQLGIPTGIASFDSATGGVMKGELAILVGETGIGKSIGLENFGINAWLLNMNVLYVSIEMIKSQVEFRMDSRLTGILYKKFRLGTIDDKDFLRWKKEMERWKASKDNYFEVVCLPRGCTSMEIENEADRCQEQYGEKLDLIIVDYLNIMNPNQSIKGASSRDWQTQSAIAFELKELSVGFGSEGIAVWSGNQVTDEGEGRGELKKSHIKYGRGIGEIANIVTALVQTQDDELEGIMRLQTIKVRDTPPISPIILRPNFDVMVLDDEYRDLRQGSLGEWRKR